MTTKEEKQNLENASDLIEDVLQNGNPDIDVEPQLEDIVNKLSEAQSYYD